MEEENKNENKIKWGGVLFKLFLLGLVLKFGMAFYNSNIKGRNCGWNDIPKVFWNIYGYKEVLPCTADSNRIKIIKAIQK